MDCIFCKIAAGEIPSDIVYQDEDLLVFRDLNPQAPVHLLLIPKAHIPSANQLTTENSDVIAKIFERIPALAEELGFDKAGYRIVNNCGEDGGQTVSHLHFHLLAGRSLQWPPG